MAIFNQSDSPSQDQHCDKNTTIITAGAKIRGDLELSCNLYIDGELEGKIIASQEVNVGKSGFISGEIQTERLIVQGRIEGSVEANRVEIKAGGAMNGQITSQELIIEAKGIFEGNSIIKNSKVIISEQEKIEKV